MKINEQYERLLEAKGTVFASRGFQLNPADKRVVEFIVGKHHVATPFPMIEQDIRDRILKHNTPAPGEHVIAAYVKHARTAHNRNIKEYRDVMGGGHGYTGKGK